MTRSNAEDRAAAGLARLLSPLKEGSTDNFGDRTETIYQRRYKKRRRDREEFCPYIGIAGNKVDLHSSKLYPAKNHVGVKPAQSPGTVIIGGGGGNDN